MKSFGHLKHVHIQHNRKKTRHLPSLAPSQPIVSHLPVFSISGTGIHLHLFSYKRHKHIHGTSLVIQSLGLGACTAKHRLHFIWQPAFRGHDALHGTTQRSLLCSHSPVLTQLSLLVSCLEFLKNQAGQKVPDGNLCKFLLITVSSASSTKSGMASICT